MFGVDGWFFREPTVATNSKLCGKCLDCAGDLCSQFLFFSFFVEISLIDARIAAFPRVLKLHGRLELMFSQIALRSGNSEVGTAEALPLAENTYTEPDSDAEDADDFDDNGMAFDDFDGEDDDEDDDDDDDDEVVLALGVSFCRFSRVCFALVGFARRRRRRRRRRWYGRRR